jgi:hypothetical protein
MACIWFTLYGGPTSMLANLGRFHDIHPGDEVLEIVDISIIRLSALRTYTIRIIDHERLPRQTIR